MATKNITSLIKRSAVPAKVPATTDLSLGELAINTYDGKVYIKKNDGSDAVVQVGGTRTVSETPPASAQVGDIWIESDTGIEYHYYSDGDTAQWVEFNGTSIPSSLTVNDLTVTTTTKVGTNLIFDKAAGHGIKVDTTTPTYPWADITAPLDIKTTGATAPTFATFIGNIGAFQCDTTGVPGSARTFHVVYHIPHDYAPGTDLFWHVHWAHNSASVTSGSVTWAYEVSYAKGFDQATFITPLSGSFAQTASTVRYQHMVAEGQISVAGGSGSQLNTTNMEPDGLLILAFSCSANTMNGSGIPFVFTADLHYQSTNIGTKNKAPNFYG